MREQLDRMPERRSEGRLEAPAPRGATPIGELPFEVDLPDMAAVPEFVASTAWRLRATDAAQLAQRQEGHERFLELIEGLHLSSTAFTVTTRLGVRAVGGERRIHADLVVAALGGPGAAQELAAVGAQIERRLVAAGAPFSAERCDPGELGWPTTGQGVFLRQAVFAARSEPTEDDDPEDELVVPLRFAPPAPGRSERLIETLLAAGPGIDLFISVAPTRLRVVEHRELERLRRAAVADHGPLGERLTASAVDAVASYRTAVSMIQILLVSEAGPPEVVAHQVAASITAPFDTETFEGARVVAMPNRYARGGSSIEPCRNPTDALARLRSGLTQVGLPERDLADLVTATEIGHLLGWPTRNDGTFPGLPSTVSTSPVVPPGPAVVLGTDPVGSPVAIADEDRPLHLLFVGGTGSGKTTLFHHLAAQDLAADRTVIAIVPELDLLARIAGSVPTHRHDRVYFIDGRDGSADRFNLLRPGPARQVPLGLLGAVVEGATTDLNADYAGPIFLDNARVVLRVAAGNGKTLADALSYLNDPELLRRDAAQIGDDLAVEHATNWAGASDTWKSEVAAYVRSKFSWCEVAGIAGSVCTQAATLDLADALEPGAVLLVHPGEDPQAAATFSSVMLAVLLSHLTERHLDSPPISVYLDEVQRFTGNVVRRAMNETRKRAVALHLATQNLSNVAGQLEAMVGNAGHLVVGRASGATAAFAQTELGVTPGATSRLPNLHAMARLTVDGVPSETFALEIDPPTGPRRPQMPDWLALQIERRRGDRSRPSGADDRRNDLEARLDRLLGVMDE